MAEAKTTKSRPNVSASLRASLLTTLSELAVARQGDVTDAALEIYIRALAGYDLRDVQSACEQLAKQPREDFRPAYPELGDVIRTVCQARDSRAAAKSVKFQPCGRSEYGGIAAGYQGDYRGAECSGGMWIYWATGHNDAGRDMYGKPVRWAKQCQCMVAWKQQRAMGAA